MTKEFCCKSDDIMKLQDYVAFATLVLSNHKKKPLKHWTLELCILTSSKFQSIVVNEMVCIQRLCHGSEVQIVKKNNKKKRPNLER